MHRSLLRRTSQQHRSPVTNMTAFYMYLFLGTYVGSASDTVDRAIDPITRTEYSHGVDSSPPVFRLGSGALVAPSTNPLTNLHKYRTTSLLNNTLLFAVQIISKLKVNLKITLFRAPETIKSSGTLFHQFGPAPLYLTPPKDPSNPVHSFQSTYTTTVLHPSEMSFFLLLSTVLF